MITGNIEENESNAKNANNATSVSSILSYTPPISSSGFSAFTTNGSTIGEAEVDGRQAAAFGRRDTTPAGAGPIAAGSTTTVPGGGRSAGPLQAFHYVGDVRMVEVHLMVQIAATVRSAVVLRVGQMAADQMVGQLLLQMDGQVVLLLQHQMLLVAAER
uniref:Uncharacterized protein n=1 Tax=Anopheles merus TaxID=30066 RepID=A0A182VMT6_ANOME